MIPALPLSRQRHSFRRDRSSHQFHQNTMSVSPSPPHLSRSGGCLSCRRMKVKCDQQLPGCLRCRKAHRVCPGYREEVDNFRSMNESTEQKAKLSRNQSKHNQERSPSASPKARSRSLPIVQEPDVVFLGSNGQTQTQVPLIPSMPTNRLLPAQTVAIDWRTQIVQGFLAVFVHDRSSIPVWLDFLPDLYNDDIQDASFTDAVNAVSLMHFSQRTSMEMFAIQARRCYGRALVQASGQLNMLDQSTSDHLLATLSLLDLYEV